ncbi:MAG: precorrin-6x reductase [Paracoccaceae bacterium]|jgi:precorrin-6x reductase
MEIERGAMADGQTLRDAIVVIAGDSAEAAGLRAALHACGAIPVDAFDGAMKTAELAGLGVGADAIAVVCACHPFDARGPDAARALAHRLGAAHLALRRPLWRPGPGDHWLRARNGVHAARLMPHHWRRVFLAVGRDRIAPFAAAGDRRWFVRAQAPTRGLAPERLLRHASLLDDPGPYAPAAEARLFRRLGVDVLIARNTGGDGARPKILGARLLGLPVVLIEPPLAAPPGSHRDIASVMAALHRLAAAR